MNIATTPKFEAFAAANPVVAKALLEKIDASNFAASLVDGILKYGSLTERQLAAAEKCFVQKPVVGAVEVDINPIANKLNAAVESGLKKPAIRLACEDGTLFKFSLAVAPSVNAGAIYVKDEFGEYLGKIADGKFIKARDCLETKKAKVVDVCNDPAKAAVRYGQLTNRCACCGKELTDPESIKNNIGPVCAKRFGLF